MERYYNFGGEGVFAARRLERPAVLEVNAPIVDYPGSPKHRLDRALVIEPMRRWRDRIARHVQLFVTTTADILPSWVDRDRVLEIEWGADVEHFQPRSGGERRFVADPNRIQCVFAGAFRSWHGVVHLSATLARLHQAGDHRFGAIFIGDGPERAAAERVARGVPAITFTGALPHAELPAALASADIGVAPFDTVRHAPLRLGFYWSPLKIYEYMAVGLPVVAPALPRLRRLVEHGREGLLYDPSEPRGLDHAIVSLADAARTAAAWARPRGRVSSATSAGRRIAPRWTSACAPWSLDESAAQRSRRDRLVPARLRRQRMEHVGARARTAGPWPPR